MSTPPTAPTTGNDRVGYDTIDYPPDADFARLLNFWHRAVRKAEQPDNGDSAVSGNYIYYVQRRKDAVSFSIYPMGNPLRVCACVDFNHASNILVLYQNKYSTVNRPEEDSVFYKPRLYSHRRLTFFSDVVEELPNIARVRLSPDVSQNILIEYGKYGEYKKTFIYPVKQKTSCENFNFPIKLETDVSGHVYAQCIISLNKMEHPDDCAEQQILFTDLL